MRVDLGAWIGRAEADGQTVHLLVGRDDSYGPYAAHLFERFGHRHVRLHRAGGNHHLLFHRPRETALRLAAMLRK